MFQAIDALWDECRDETLSGFLSEASPFTFKEAESADPAIWSEFSKAFDMQFPEGCKTLDEAYMFARSYLEGISDEYSKVYPGSWRLDDAFVEIASLEKWNEAFEPYIPEG